MKKINLLLVAGLLLTTALSSCKKEEIKPAAAGGQKDTDIKTFARNRNYVEPGILVVGRSGRFATCKYGGPACMVVVRPVITYEEDGRYIMTPEEGEPALQVDKFKESGIETSFYSRIDVNTAQDGKKTFYFTE